MVHLPRALATLALSTSVLAFPSLSSRAQAASQHCGKSDNVILQGTPWIVYNMLYNANLMVGTQCTNFDQVTGGNKEVLWNSVTDIQYVESTNNVPKGYSFVGLTENLATQLSTITSIPSTYSWTRTNTTAFKGNVCFDFIINDIKDDSTSSSARELMLWLQYEGGQLPIGWTDGAISTVNDLFGTSWKLYQGVNEGTGITVITLMPETQFAGTFTGDLKDWLLALSKLGHFPESTYVNVGNAGTEFFYGNAVLKAQLGLQITLG
ncbi:concanavalin A-like lectin/glucanase domain-containing protein [Aspergillus coremiiformis]|uniref:xyloglucan-specific endo-beta-1,4-glucanase n=1 Tax=Aspergillus coremiiformis TaxID=138285 RepID=A0A5N6YXY4_9EURO|nr:concanavalin A-like lectin/glucanase domain-containing protein [Aspergillus coremiiformis]